MKTQESGTLEDDALLYSGALSPSVLRNRAADANGCLAVQEARSTLFRNCVICTGIAAVVFDKKLKRKKSVLRRARHAIAAKRR